MRPALLQHQLKGYLVQHLCQRVELGTGSFPDTKWGTAVMEYPDKREARLAWVCLPSFCYADHFQRGEPRWAQRILQYHGWYGLRVGLRFEDGWVQ